MTAASTPIAGFLLLMAAGVCTLSAEKPNEKPKTITLPAKMVAGKPIKLGEIKFLKEQSLFTERGTLAHKLSDGTELLLDENTKLVVSEYAPARDGGRSLDFIHLFTGRLTVKCGRNASVLISANGGTLSADGGEHQITITENGWAALCKTERLYVLHDETGMFWQQESHQEVKVEKSGRGATFTKPKGGKEKILMTLPPPKQPKRKEARGNPSPDTPEAEKKKDDAEKLPLLIEISNDDTLYVERVSKSIEHWPWRPNQLWLPELVTVGGREIVYQEYISSDRFLVYAYIGDFELTLPGGRETALFEGSFLIFPVITLPGLPTGALPPQKRRYLRLHDFKRTSTSPIE